MTTFRLTPRGRFSLEASTRFLDAFAPAAYERAQAPLGIQAAGILRSTTSRKFNAGLTERLARIVSWQL